MPEFGQYRTASNGLCTVMARGSCKGRTVVARGYSALEKAGGS
jgi:hypothetical protein